MEAAGGIGWCALCRALRRPQPRRHYGNGCTACDAPPSGDSVGEWQRRGQGLLEHWPEGVGEDADPADFVGNNTRFMEGFNQKTQLQLCTGEGAEGAPSDGGGVRAPTHGVWNAA
eukprot:gene51326-36072_t